MRGAGIDEPADSADRQLNSDVEKPDCGACGLAADCARELALDLGGRAPLASGPYCEEPEEGQQHHSVVLAKVIIVRGVVHDAVSPRRSSKKASRGPLPEAAATLQALEPNSDTALRPHSHQQILLTHSLPLRCCRSCRLRESEGRVSRATKNVTIFTRMKRQVEKNQQSRSLD